MRLRAWFFPLALGALNPGGAAAGPWTQYTNINEITALADDGRNVWLGTSGGLIRISKAAAETTWFNQANSPLSDSRIRSLASDGKGRIAAITRGGAFVEYDGVAWSTPGNSDAFRGQAPIDLAWGAGDALWAVAIDPKTRKPSLFRRRNGQWIRIYLEGSDALYPDAYSGYGYSPYLSPALRTPWLQSDGRGAIWATVLRGTSPRAYRFDADGNRDSAAVPTALDPIQMVAADSGEPYWICRQHLARFAAGGWDTTRRNNSAFAASRSVHPRNLFARDSDGSELWAIGYGAILRRNADGWDSVTHPDLRGAYPSLVLAASGGGRDPARIYAATRTGFGAISGKEWNPADLGETRHHAGSNPILRAEGSGRGAMLLGSNSGLEEFDPPASGFQRLDLGAAWGTQGVTSLFTDQAGRTWVTTMDSVSGLRVLGRSAWIDPPDSSGWGFYPGIYAAPSYIAEDTAGTLWFANRSRLLSSPGGSEDARTWASHPLPWDAISSIASVKAHRDGSIWIAALTTVPGTPPKIARFFRSAWRTFDTLPTSAFSLANFREMHCDAEGNVWLRFPEGLLRWDGKGWSALSWAGQPRLGLGIAAMAVDLKGTLWAATAAPEADLVFWEQGWQTVPGAAGAIATTSIRSLAFDGSGRIWMASESNGVLVYDPADATVSARPSVAGRAGGQAFPARRPDGSWRFGPGSIGMRGPLIARIRDFRGKALPGNPLRLRPAPEGGWICPGPEGRLPPGRYLLTIEDGGSGRMAFPFRQIRP